MRLSLAVAVLGCSTHVLAQVSVTESATRAELREGKTSITLALKNAGTTPVDARIRLRWLSPKDYVDRESWRDITLTTGESSHALDHALPDDHNPNVKRLEYAVYPAERNFTAFSPVIGILALPSIADYAFTLGILTTKTPKPGQPYELCVITSHPVTGRPIAGVTVAASDVTAVTSQDGLAILKVQREETGSGSFVVKAHIGDFKGEGESILFINSPDDIRAFTDKPLYQPGQTMHLRILALQASGEAKSGFEYELRVLSKSGDLAHAAKVRTSRFGIASTDWNIPEGTESGRYDIQIKGEEVARDILASVDIRRYELPSFRVKASLDRTFYLQGQKAAIEVAGEYLFGKPVTSGKVRIIDLSDPGTALVGGTLDAEGRFRATLKPGAALKDKNYVDLHLAALLTEGSTNRTEERKFDLRVSRDSIHVYLLRHEDTPAGRRIYVTTYSPDGKPLGSDIRLLDRHKKILATGKTNRFGLAKIELPPGSDSDLTLHAVTSNGAQGQLVNLEERRHPADLSLQTDRSLYRIGETIRCKIVSAQADNNVWVLAMDHRDRIVFARSLQLPAGHGEVEIPYEKRFGRIITISAVSKNEDRPVSRRVYYPGPGDLTVKATPAKAIYGPGETASIHSGLV